MAPRVRFCPAPSGWLHVGGARTALYNWLYARGSGGEFVFRVEDTDVDRAEAEAIDGMVAAMGFLGLDWDEGPGVGGPYGPYRQSERTPLYAAVVSALLEAGAAYDAYETPEELEAERRAAQEAGRPPGYSGAHRHLTQQQREAFLAEGRKPVIRMRTPDEGTVAFEDRIRGPVEFAWSDIADFVVQRADGTATYFLANALDDLAMGMTLIARGEDLLAATPRQLLLYEAMERDKLLDTALGENGFPPRPPAAAESSAEAAARSAASGESSPDPAVRPPTSGGEWPEFAHLPLIVGSDRKPLSKRHGSVAVDEFRRQGFLPEVLVNFLALLGWSWDDRQERFTVDELVEKFSFDRVGKNPALFDTDKLRSLNGDRIKELPDAELAERLQPYLEAEGLLSEPATPDEQQLLLGLAPLLRERIQTLAEAAPLIDFCFRDVVSYDDKAVAKHLSGRAGEVLDAAEEALADVEWTGEAILAALDGVAEQLGMGRGKAFQPVRVAVAGKAVSPPLPETLALLDRDVVLERIRAAKPRVSSG